MKRREFIRIAAAGAAGMVVPGVGRDGASTRFALARPGLLQFFPEDGIYELGRRYRETVPAENYAAALMQALAADAWADRAGWSVFSDIHADSLHTDLAVMVQRDFATGQTVMLNGWIVSLTEARQCALFSLQPA